MIRIIRLKRLFKVLHILKVLRLLKAKIPTEGDKKTSKKNVLAKLVAHLELSSS